jgi:hypothetical protein
MGNGVGADVHASCDLVVQHVSAGARTVRVGLRHVVRVIVPPDLSGRVFEDDLDPGDLVFDGKLTPMLVWHEHYPVGRGWRSGWVLNYDTDGNGNPDDYIVGLGLPDVDAAVAQAREYLRSVGYPAAGWPSS